MNSKNNHKFVWWWNFAFSKVHQFFCGTVCAALSPPALILVPSKIRILWLMFKMSWCDIEVLNFIWACHSLEGISDLKWLSAILQRRDRNKYWFFFLLLNWVPNEQMKIWLVLDLLGDLKEASWSTNVWRTVYCNSTLIIFFFFSKGNFYYNVSGLWT